MKLEPRTIQILKNFASINQSLIFNAGDQDGSDLSTISPSKTILAKAWIKEEIPCKFGIYDLNRFINAMSIFQEVDIEPSEKVVTIKGPNGAVTRYTCTDPGNIVSPPAKEIAMPKVDVEFWLTDLDFTKAMKALGILGLPEVAITGDREKVYLEAIDSKNPTSDNFKLPLGETSSEFKFIFKAENLKILSGDYAVKISSKGLANFVGANVEYYIAVESNGSSFTA
jgi:hypothetical protein